MVLRSGVVSFFREASTSNHRLSIHKATSKPHWIMVLTLCLMHVSRLSYVLLDCSLCGHMWYWCVELPGIASFTDHGKLELFREVNYATLRETTITLNADDVLVMRGDTIHASAASERGHFGRIRSRNSI